MYSVPQNVPEGAAFAFVFSPDSVPAVSHVQATPSGCFINDPIGPSDAGLRGWGVPVSQITADVFEHVTSGPSQLLGVELWFDTQDWGARWNGTPSEPAGAPAE